MELTENFKSFTQSLSYALDSEGFRPSTYELLNISSQLHMSYNITMPVATPWAPDTIREFINSDDALAFAIRSLANVERKILAIQALRKHTGCGLRDAKDAVDEYVSIQECKEALRPLGSF